MELYLNTCDLCGEKIEHFRHRVVIKPAQTQALKPIEMELNLHQACLEKILAQVLPQCVRKPS